MHYHFGEEGVCVWWDRDGGGEGGRGRGREWEKGREKTRIVCKAPSHILGAQPVTNPITGKMV